VDNAAQYLRGAEGYYAAQANIEGLELYYRELTPEEYREFMEKQREAQGASGMKVTADMLTDRAAFEVAATTRGLEMTPEQQSSALQATWDAIDCVVGHGMVKWSLEAPCTPENVARLRNRIKRQLFRLILQETQRTGEDEGLFPATPER
jgi:hypothetical protein